METFKSKVGTTLSRASLSVELGVFALSQKNDFIALTGAFGFKKR